MVGRKENDTKIENNITRISKSKFSSSFISNSEIKDPQDDIL